MLITDRLITARIILKMTQTVKLVFQNLENEEQS